MKLRINIQIKNDYLKNMVCPNTLDCIDTGCATELNTDNPELTGNFPR